jgi:hypothetical protein
MNNSPLIETKIVTVTDNKNKEPRKIKITKTIQKLKPKEGMSKHIPFHRIIFDYEFFN